MKVDVVIFGGGIAGLWSLALLRKSGYHAILIDSGKLGGMQSLASQGMIHGGQRYALQGASNEHSTMLKDLPEIWNRCLSGSGEVDLSGVKVLADSQLMWSPGALTDRVAAFFASKVMQSEVKAIKNPMWPKGLRDNCGRAGAVYKLNEVVVDCNSLFDELARLCSPWCYQGTAVGFTREGSAITAVTVKGGTSANDEGDLVTIHAQAFIAAAGLGNEVLRDMIGAEHVMTQRRPLKQIYLKGAPFDLFAHCITTDPRPRATITTHINSHGERLWYMGGLVGVYGVDKSDKEALLFAIQEMRSLFPKVDWSRAEWATLSIDRAEPKVESGFLPDGPALVEGAHNFLFAWPTKMTFAPLLAHDVTSWISGRTTPSVIEASGEGCGLRQAQVAAAPWDNLSWTSSEAVEVSLQTAY
jgi:glycerol-3-phosphate dehydrogenase